MNPPTAPAPSGAARRAGALLVAVASLTLAVTAWGVAASWSSFVDAGESTILRVLSFGLPGLVWGIFALALLMMLGIAGLLVRSGRRVARGDAEAAENARPVALALALVFAGLAFLGLGAAVAGEGFAGPGDYGAVAVVGLYAGLFTAARHFLDRAVERPPADGGGPGGWVP